MEGTNLVTCLCGGMIITFMIFLASGIRFVPEYRRLFVYRLGVFIGEKGPGLVYQLPIVDRGVSIDLRNEVSKAQSFQNTTFGANGEIKTSVDADGEDMKIEKSLQEYLLEIFKRIKVSMDPDYDLGIKNVRIRGIIRMLLGILLTAVFVLLTIGGAYIYFELGIYRLEDNEERGLDLFSILLFVLPLLSTLFASIHLLWGIVELLLNKSWNQISSPIRLLLILFVGVPLGVLLITSIIYLVSNIL